MVIKIWLKGKNYLIVAGLVSIGRYCLTFYHLLVSFQDQGFLSHSNTVDLLLLARGFKFPPPKKPDASNIYQPRPYLRLLISRPPFPLSNLSRWIKNMHTKYVAIYIYVYIMYVRIGTNSSALRSIETRWTFHFSSRKNVNLNSYKYYTEATGNNTGTDDRNHYIFFFPKTKRRRRKNTLV